MDKTSDFLSNFNLSLKEKMSGKLTGFFAALDSFTYYEAYDYEQEKEKIAELKNVVDKIVSIVYKPMFHTDNNRVVLRSELAGKLPYDLFTDTLKEPQFWKQKGKEMAPEYAYAYEHVDNIDIYENRFISHLIDEIDDEISRALDNMASLSESLDEHYQNNQLLFGKYSFLRNIQRMSYPYTSFSLKSGKANKEIFALAKKVKKTIKNLRGTNFYQVTSKHPSSSYYKPTNILIHDKLYSYCYRYYCANYKKSEGDNRKEDILYFNYFFVSFLSYLKGKKYLKSKNMPKVSFDEEGMLIFSPFKIVQSPFAFSIKENKEDVGLNIEVTLSFDEHTESSSLYLLPREKITSKTLSSIDPIKKKVNSKMVLVTENNLLSHYDSILTYSHYKKGNTKLLDDLFSLMTILIYTDDDSHASLCPVCGKNKIIFNGKRYLCQDCHSEYVSHNINGDPLLWITSYRKEC